MASAERYLELAKKIPEIVYDSKVPAESVVEEIISALRRLAEIESLKPVAWEYSALSWPTDTVPYFAVTRENDQRPWMLSHDPLYRLPKQNEVSEP